MAERKKKGEEQSSPDLVSGPPAAAMFLGVGAAVTLNKKGEPRPLKAIRKAEEMRVRGAKRSEIHAETSKMLDGTPYAGVTYGADKMPRFELDDSTAKFHRAAIPAGGKAFQKDVLDHPELYTADPTAAHLTVARSKTNGSSINGSDIEISDRRFLGQIAGREVASLQARGHNLHELQHHIQDGEGHAPGGTPADFVKQYPGNKAKQELAYSMLAGEVEAEMTRKREHMTAQQRRQKMPEPDIPYSQQIVLRADADSVKAKVDMTSVVDAARAGWNTLLNRDTFEGKPIRSRKLDPLKVGANPDVFQFKSGGDGAGVTDRLKGVKTWDPVAAGKSVVYEWADGRLDIADGHQRRGLAQRLAKEGQNVQLDALIMRERDGWSPRDVRVYAAMKNIKEGSGNVLDMAKVMRERPDLANGSLPMSDAKVRDAVSLSKLSPEAFGMVAGGVVKPEHAAAVGAMGDTTRHASMLSEMAKAEIGSAQHARLYVQQAMAAPQYSETTGSLFGEETQTRSLLAERAKVLDKALQHLKSDKKIFGLLEREAGSIEEAGNKLAHETNAARAEGAGRTAELVERLAMNRGPVSDMLDQAARDLAEGRTPSQAARNFVRGVHDTLKTSGMAGLTGDAPRPAAAPVDPNQVNMFGGSGERPGWSDEARASSLEVRRNDLMSKTLQLGDFKQILEKIGVPFEVEHSKSMSDRFGPSLSSYYKVNGPNGPVTFRVSDHEYTPRKNDLRLGQSYAAAQAHVLKELGRDVPHDILSRAQEDLEASREASRIANQRRKDEEIAAKKNAQHQKSEKTKNRDANDALLAANGKANLRGQPRKDALNALKEGKKPSKPKAMMDSEFPTRKPAKINTASAAKWERELSSIPQDDAEKRLLDRRKGEKIGASKRTKMMADDMLGGPSTKDKIAAAARAKEAKGRTGDPMDVGMFGSSKDQTDLVDMAKQAPKESATIKGRVGDFEYGYEGKQKWIIRDRRTGEVVDRDTNQSGASRKATRLYDIDSGKIKIPDAMPVKESGLQEVRMGGELSSYLVDQSTGTVKQVKTNHMTGKQIVTDITGKPKAKQVIEYAARTEHSQKPPAYDANVASIQDSSGNNWRKHEGSGAWSVEKGGKPISDAAKRNIDRLEALGYQPFRDAAKALNIDASGGNSEIRARLEAAAPFDFTGKLDEVTGKFTRDARANAEADLKNLVSKTGAPDDVKAKAVAAGMAEHDRLDTELMKGRPGWSDAARAASAEVRAADAKHQVLANGDKVLSKAEVKRRMAEAKALPNSDPTRSLKIEHVKILAGTAWRPDGSAYSPGLEKLTADTLKSDQAKAFAQTKRGARASKPRMKDADVKHLMKQGLVTREDVKTSGSMDDLKGKARQSAAAKLKDRGAGSGDNAKVIEDWIEPKGKAVSSKQPAGGKSGAVTKAPKKTSGKRGTQNAANLEAIIENRQANAKAAPLSQAATSAGVKDPAAQMKDVFGPRKDHIPGVGNQFSSLSPGMRREIARHAAQKANEAKPAEVPHQMTDAGRSDRYVNRMLAAGSNKSPEALKAEFAAKTASAKPVGRGRKALGLLMPVAIGTAMLAASNQAKAEGRGGDQAKDAVKAGIESGAVMAGFTIGGGVAVKGLMRAGMTVARAAPVVQGAFMAYGAISQGLQAYKDGGGMKDIAKGAAKGAWDMSLPGMVVNTAKDASAAMAERRRLETTPGVAGIQRFNHVAAVYKSKAEMARSPMVAPVEPSDGNNKARGWANAKVQAAAQAAKGRQFSGVFKDGVPLQ